MSNRVVYGNSWSSNGWPMVDEGSCTWVDIPGTDPTVRIEIQNGQPLQILRAFVADINAYVEHVTDSDTGCWTAGNSVSTSNHLSGTAVDISWSRHPFRIADAGWNLEQINTIREIQDFYEGTVFWGNDWTDPKDAMHFQLASLSNGGDIDTYQNPHTQDFITRKIRADGFSTYQRGNAPVVTTPSVMTVPLVQNANGTWTSPSPAWAHLIRRESGGNPTIIQQIIDVNSGGNEAEGLFQITPRTWATHNGTEFAPSPRLATPQQQAIVAARIFVGNPSGGDWGAGLPGRENAAQLAAGLVPTTDIQDQGDDDLSAEAERLITKMSAQIDRLEAEYTPDRRGPTRSFFGESDQGVETPLGYLWNIDANVWNQQLTWGYLLGAKRAEEFVNRVAATGVAPESWAGKLTDAQGNWLAEFGQEYCRGLITLRVAMQKAFQSVGASVPQVADAQVAVPQVPQPVTAVVDTRELTAAYNEIARLREENARLQAVQQPITQPVSTEIATAGDGSTGDVAKTVIDAVEGWTDRALAMDTKQRAALTASMTVLQLNGNQS